MQRGAMNENHTLLPYWETNSRKGTATHQYIQLQQFETYDTQKKNGLTTHEH